MIETVHWNPRRFRPTGPLRRLPAVGPRVNNFGDLLGPRIVAEIERQEQLDPDQARDKRLLAVGSILTLARPGDTVWGVGVNGKSVARDMRLESVDFRAVRGPLTRDWAIARGGSVPERYGDPGLLVGHLWRDALFDGVTTRRTHTIVPNFHDFASLRRDPRTLSPTLPIGVVLKQIASSTFVCGSSLHGVIVAESLGIPARFVSSEHEPRFKYDDYMLGTGRSPAVFASSVAEAIDMGGQDPAIFDPFELLRAFPRDLWRDE